jgi:hypothetical protein
MSLERCVLLISCNIKEANRSEFVARREQLAVRREGHAEESARETLHLQLGHLLAGAPIPELHDVGRASAVARDQFAVG